MSEEIDLTSSVETLVVRDTKGDLRVGLKLTPDDYETLIALQQSHYWKFYRSLLLQTKVAYADSLVQMDDPNKILKTTGILAGINIAVNQLPVLIAEYLKTKGKEKQDLEKKKEPAVPFKRG